jgi:prevent-host-death family protein
MRTVNIHEATTQFSKLIEAVTRGEQFVIVRAGKPAALLVPMQVHKPVRQPGAMKGKIRIADDFDVALPETLHAAFRDS